jgi:hypothetical protein
MWKYRSPMWRHGAAHLKKVRVPSSDIALLMMLLHVLAPVHEQRNNRDVGIHGEVVGLPGAEARLVCGHVGQPARGQVVQDQRRQRQLAEEVEGPHFHVPESFGLAGCQLDAHVCKLHGGRCYPGMGVCRCEGFWVRTLPT